MIKYILDKIKIKDLEIDVNYLDIVSYNLEDIKNRVFEIGSSIYNDFINKEKYSINEFYLEINPIFYIIAKSDDYIEFDSKQDQLDYYNTTKNLIIKENLFEYLMMFIDNCILEFDYNFNLLEAKCIDEENSNSFSYKTLFPDIYHIEKYNDGDKVRYKYDKNIYTVWKYKNDKRNSIYESDDPLNYREGYYLLDDTGYIYDGGDMFSYLAVDEDLEPVELDYKILTQSDIKDFFSYIKLSNFDNLDIIDDISSIKYNKFKREDNKYRLVFIDNEQEIDTNSTVFAISFYDDNKLLASMISMVFDNKKSNNNLRLYYKDHFIKEFTTNKTAINAILKLTKEE